ncbi:hypothetical protein Y032_0738g1954 [Ancylostoma ceylanicum]|uniref:Uncharacterized protein n=1 Tax=Ancylostoma ceylanicum TaxID=53326 RepID=A0A016WGN5_9BILA|nr:hypothetical protein Y032_0738g1954 [Ancylostoma ceylanicum]
MYNSALKSCPASEPNNSYYNEMASTVRLHIDIAKRQLRKALGEMETQHAEPAQIQQLKDDDLLTTYEEQTLAH